MLKTFRVNSELVTGILISIVSLSAYICTMSPTVSFIDSGELATVALTLGIAHPTGYPIFTLLAHVFGTIPLGLRAIVQLNAFAVLLCSVSLFFFFRTFSLICKEFVTLPGKRRAGNQPADWHNIAPAALGALLLGFSETFWSQALSIEVYPLHLLFLSLILFTFLKGISSDLNQRNTELADGARSHRGFWFIFAYLLGLSFTNHLTTILLAPGFVYLFFSVNGFSSRSWKRILLMAGPFLLGFSAQAYLFIRAGGAPLLNWGDPSTFERFLWHFGGKVYRVWFFSSVESAMKQLRYFGETLPAEFALLPLVIAVIGISHLLRSSRQLGIFVLLLFGGCVGYSINYDIHDIDSYFLLAYVAIGVWIVAGSRYLIGRFGDRAGKTVMSGSGIALVAVLLVFQYPRVDQSRNTIVENYARKVLDSVEPQSIVISYQWDYFISASYYLQHVEGVRTDVTVIDKELLRRTWYLEQLRYLHPWLMESVQKEADLLEKELYKFEHDLPYTGAVIEERYRALIAGIIRYNIGVRKIYVTPEIEAEYTSGFTRFPHGLAFQLAPPGIMLPVEIPDFSIPEVGRSTKYTDGILSMYAQAYLFHAQFAFGRGERTKASGLLDKALEIRPEYREAIFLKQKIAPSGD